MNIVRNKVWWAEFLENLISCSSCSLVLLTVNKVTVLRSYELCVIFSPRRHRGSWSVCAELEGSTSWKMSTLQLRYGCKLLRYFAFLQVAHRGQWKTTQQHLPSPWPSPQINDLHGCSGWWPAAAAHKSWKYSNASLMASDWQVIINTPHGRVDDTVYHHFTAPLHFMAGGQKGLLGWIRVAFRFLLNFFSSAKHFFLHEALLSAGADLMKGYHCSFTSWFHS